MAANSLLHLRRRLQKWTLVAASLCATGTLQAKAANNCPWMSETTASSLLGGDASGVYVAPADGKPAICSFTQQTAQGERSLQVTVEVVADPQSRLTQAEQTCGSDPAPLHAIGNEAIFCTGESRPDRRTERAVGRVRDQLFVIIFATSVKDDAVLTRDALKAKIYTASEQVAGNLF